MVWKMSLCLLLGIKGKYLSGLTISVTLITQLVTHVLRRGGKYSKQWVRYRYRTKNGQLHLPYIFPWRIATGISHAFSREDKWHHSAQPPTADIKVWQSDLWLPAACPAPVPEVTIPTMTCTCFHTGKHHVLAQPTHQQPQDLERSYGTMLGMGLQQRNRRVRTAKASLGCNSMPCTSTDHKTLAYFWHWSFRRGKFSAAVANFSGFLMAVVVINLERISANT